jgi:hypothetical protein
LFLNSFDASKAQAHPTVCAYYASLLTETTTEATTPGTVTASASASAPFLKQTVFAVTKKRSLVEQELEEQEQEQVPKEGKKRNEDSSLSTPYVYVKKINL